jgi:hypothetical protein
MKPDFIDLYVALHSLYLAMAAKRDAPPVVPV